MSTRTPTWSRQLARLLAARAVPLAGTLALATTWLFAVGCGGSPTDSEENVGESQSGLTLTLSTPTTYTLASTAIPGGITVSGGTPPYSCVIGINSSGGTSCSATGGTISYTPGATAGFNIKVNHTSNYLLNNAGRCETGGAIGTSAELFLMAVSGAGYTLQLKSNNKYVHTTGTALYCDGTSSETFLMQGCTNGTSYNRYGFATTTGSGPYWKNNAAVTIDTYTAGNGSACDPSSASAWEAFYLVPGIDQLTITDSASNTGTLQVSVEKPLFFNPASQSVVANGTATVQSLGGSVAFTGGSSACAVLTNNTASTGGCSVAAGGAVTYVAGPTSGIDTLRVTDSQSHTGTFTVQVSPAMNLSTATSYALAGSALGTSVTVSGGSGSGTYSCAVSTNTSGATCSVSGSTVSYTAGSTAGYNIRVNRTGDYVRLVSASGGPYLQMGGAIGSSAELFKMAVSGAGYTFQAVSNGLFVRAMGTVNAGSDLVADTSTGDVFTMQNCNGSGDPTHYNRWGFKSPGSGTKPYWQSASSVVQIEANNNGNAGVCATTSATAWEAFYLDPGQDVLTITDTAQHSSTVTVTVQPPITFTSPTFAVAGSTPVSNQALGGNGTFTGGSAGCTVTTNATGGGSCTTTAWGTVGYTPGNTSGTDTITLTDSVGHTGYFTVSVGVSLSQLSAGPNYFSCAKVSDGTARCWGSNGMSELGQGFTSTYSATPVTVRGLSGVSSVVTGENHACALLSNNTIKCWGDNQFGQLGNGTTTTSWTPVTVSGISDATAVSAGMHHTCALRSGGTVVCWGYNASYQIGNSSATYWPRATSPATVTGLSSVTAIAAGGFHNCALTGGAVKCWGDNSFGQLGNGSSTNSFSPVSVTSLTSGVSGIAGGEQHACAVKSGYVKCWGDNTYGQLGDGTKTNRSTPVSVQSLVNVAEVAAGYPFTCARITDKSVKCWGRNAEGELGDTTTTERLIPTTVAAINTVNSISAGGLNACAALSSGLGTCWGYNGYGQIGNNSTTNVTTPTGVTFGCQTCNQPDVIVSNTTWSPASVSAGGNVTFSATVFNAGTGITPVGTIVGLRWDIDGGQTNWSDSFTTGLAPGASVTLAANGGGAGSIWTTTSGSHTLQAWVDDVNRFGESDETNNKFSRTMTLGVDLVVSSLTWSPSTPSSGTQTTFSCVVTNIGTTATPGGTILGVRFDIDGSIVNWEDAYTTSLAAGASVTLTATGGPSGWSYWPATSGTHTLQGWVDDVNRFGEVNRGNNTTTTTFIVP